MQPKTLRLLIPYILLSATTYPVAKDGLNFGSPFVLMSIRYLLSALVFLVITKKILLNKTVLLSAIPLSLSTLFWILGLQYVSSGESAVLSYTMPFFAILGSALVLHERASPRQVSGAVIGFSGTTIFALHLFQGFQLIGSILTVAGAVSWATYTIYLRKLKDEDRHAMLATAFLLCVVPFAVGSIAYNQVNWSAEFVGDAVYLSVVGSIITIYLLSALLKEERVGTITSMVFAVPMVSLAIQVIQTSILPSALELIGCAIMFFGIYIASRS